MTCTIPSRSNTSRTWLLSPHWVDGWMWGGTLGLSSDQWPTDRGKRWERPSEPDTTINKPKEEKPHSTAHGEESCIWEQEATREDLGKHTHNFKWIFAASSLQVKKSWWSWRVNYLYEWNIISAKCATHAMSSSCSESLYKHTRIASGYFWEINFSAYGLSDLSPDTPKITSLLVLLMSIITKARGARLCIIKKGMSRGDPPNPRRI